MDNGPYYKDGVARVIDLMKQTFGDYFKAYFDGQPEEIPESLLPCMMVSETVSSINFGATGTDNILETVQIIVALNKKDDIGADPEVDLTEYKIRKLVKGQDENQQYKERTIMATLRKNISMQDAILSTQIDIDFDVNVRGTDTVTQEAYITVIIERIALVPYRE